MSSMLPTPIMLRIALTLAALALCSTRAAASGFVYAAAGVPRCAAASPCAAPQLVVFDADTAARVVRLPLPVHTTPAGLAISPDGRHVYVSNLATEFDGVTSITIVDALRHVVEGTFPTAGVAGALAVRGDDSRVFVLYRSTGSGIGFPDKVGVFDTTTHAVALVASNKSGSIVGSSDFFTGILVDTATDRLIVSEWLNSAATPGFLTAYDAGTLAMLTEVGAQLGGPTGIGLSRNAQLIHELGAGVVTPGGVFRNGSRIVRDAATLAPIGNLFQMFSGPVGQPIEVARTNQLLTLSRFGATLATSPQLSRVDLTTGSGVAGLALPGSVRALTVPAGERRAYVTIVDSAGATNVTAIDLDSNTVVSSAALGSVIEISIPFAPTTEQLTSTPEGVPSCRYGLDSAFSSYAAAGGSGAVRLSTACAWEASSSDTWVRLSIASGAATATIGITVDPNNLPTSRTATLTIAGQRVTVTQAGGVSQPPFGVFETPVDGAIGVTGSLAVTGWAMDDVGVSRVRIFRDAVSDETPGLIFIGDASLVEGARPDVQAVFPAAPFNTRAGWGYLLLTNFLPGGGNGTFRLHAFVEDVEGKSTLLGSKTITVSNTTATAPFGAMDTPGQGALVSGTIVNFGWALTPQPATIPIDGSTIDVILDGVVVGHPTYNQPRSDIATLFPGFTNSAAAVGFFTIDTRTLSNGVHTIAWTVRDSLGRSAGIGSRFFSVFNATIASAFSRTEPDSPAEAGHYTSVPVESGFSRTDERPIAVASGFSRTVPVPIVQSEPRPIEGQASAAAGTTGFVYAVDTAPCALPPSCVLNPSYQVLVVESATAAVVTRLPLPPQVKPTDLAMSPDGVHLYVAANDPAGMSSITVIDARHHVVLESFALSASPVGKLAVRGDDSRLFVALGGATFSSSIAALDLATHNLVTVVTADFPQFFAGIAVDSRLDRLYVARNDTVNFVFGTVIAYDAGSLAEVGRAATGGPRGIAVSRDGQHLHVTTTSTAGPTRAGRLDTFDPVTLARLPAISPSSFFNATQGNPTEVTRTGEVLAFNFTAFSSGVLRIPLPGSSARPSLVLPGQGLQLAVPPGERRVFLTAADALDGSTKALLLAFDLDTGALASSLALNVQTPALTSSPPDVATCRYGVNSAFSSYPAAGGTGSLRLTTDCAWQASSSDAWVRVSTTSGTAGAAIGLTVDPNTLPSARTATLTIAGQLVTVTQAGGASQPPFGAFETPVDGTSGITGSLSVTGWAMDDVGVSRVRIFRDAVTGEAPGLVFIGDASLVEGARPDVAAVFPTAPFNTRAGWGYLLLTNFLPGGGNGTFRLHAFVEDVEGQSTLLGSKTVTVSNTTATAPFGAIDTPGQGQLVSGTVVNFGWALTPQPATIPIDGSTIDVEIDGVVVGHPTYNQPRSDIATLFPGFANSAAAVGFFMIDTTTLSNGVHTIAWIVRDSLGRSAGIGSRFFSVFNASAPVVSSVGRTQPEGPAEAGHHTSVPVESGFSRTDEGSKPAEGSRTVAGAGGVEDSRTEPAAVSPPTPGFVYGTVRATPCAAASPCAPPELLALDAVTNLIVVRIPLPVHTQPAGLAISPNGRHVYVSNLATEFDGVTSMTVIDALSHTVTGTFPTGASVAGQLAVRADDSQVYINLSRLPSSGIQVLGVFDTTTHAVTFPALPPPLGGFLSSFLIAAHPSMDRLYVGTATCVATSCPGALEAFDGSTLTSLARTPVALGVFSMSMSDSGKRLYVATAGATSSTRTPGQFVFDPITLDARLSNGLQGVGIASVEIADTGEVLTPGFGPGSLIRSGPPATEISIPVPLVGRPAVTRDGTRAFLAGADAIGALLIPVDLSRNLAMTPVRTPAGPFLVTSRPGAPTCQYGLSTAFVSVPAIGGEGSVRLTTDCAWSASSSDSWVGFSQASGTGSTLFLVTALNPNSSPTARTATLTIAGQRLTVTQAGGVSQPPFGAFETPADGAFGIAGSLAVTGWAMDDVGVSRVRIFRDAVSGEAPGLVFIGDASLVEGARPDVQAVFPTAPFNTRAGWGYLLLTNFLPGGGNGTFRLHAFVEDVEGQSTLLGSKTVTVSNTTATAPFGTIDTPGQGQLVSGTIVNFGWALSPQPASIPIDGSTIDVEIDGVVVGHPTYNQPRADIAALFPGFANTNGAVGFFTIDTTTLSNGVHTIAWIVRDSLGRSAGIGSRFFSVFNAGSG